MPTHIFILTRMDQLHQPLDDLLFIKPLKGEKRPVDDSAHIKLRGKESFRAAKIQTPGSMTGSAPRVYAHPEPERTAVTKLWSEPKFMKEGTLSLCPNGAGSLTSASSVFRKPLEHQGVLTVLVWLSL